MSTRVTHLMLEREVWLVNELAETNAPFTPGKTHPGQYHLRFQDGECYLARYVDESGALELVTTGAKTRRETYYQVCAFRRGFMDGHLRAQVSK